MSLLEVSGLGVSYGQGRRRFAVLEDIDLELCQGEVAGLVGESGSGKSTLAKAIVGLARAERGSIALHGAPVRADRSTRNRAFRRSVQLIFQNPYASLNPRMPVGRVIAEGMELRGDSGRRAQSREVSRLLAMVGLPENAAARYPHQFSGGQRQRIAIARALAAEPELIVADEITSALDLTTQATILELMRELAGERGVAILMISHNLGVIRSLSQRVMVMHQGRIVETGRVSDVFAAPSHPYTAALLDSMPTLGRTTARTIKLLGEPPDPHDPPAGCRFHLRCPWGPVVDAARDDCAVREPRLSPIETAADRLVACHFPLAQATGDAPEAQTSSLSL